MYIDPTYFLRPRPKGRYPSLGVSMVDATHTGGHGDENGQTRREFLFLAAGAVGAVATAGAAWSLVDSMNPAADALALATTEVNIAPIPEGMGISVLWRGKSLFVRHRTA